MKRDDANARIWRAVVFSGAMLGAPLAAGDKIAEPQQAIQPDTVESVTAKLNELDKKITAAVQAVDAAKSDTDRKAANRQLAELRTTRAQLKVKLDLLQWQADVARNEANVKRKRDALDQLLAAEKSATSEAARKTAAAKLDNARKELTVAVTALEAIKAKRPRGTDEPDRPRGRGFVLS